MEKVFHSKLVRDKIPTRIKRKGLWLESRTLTDAQFQQELRRKLVEEAREVAKATDPDELAKEIADVLEVIDELRRSNGIYASQIAAAKRKKLSTNGGYKARIFLEWVEKERDEPEELWGGKVRTRRSRKRA